MKKSIYLILGFLCLGLGAIGVVLPILPTVPFFMVTVVCFARGSERVHRWFTGTKLYEKHVEPFLEKKGMTRKAKISVMVSITILMGIGFAMMGNAPMGRGILMVVWMAHVFYFTRRVKTIKI